MPMIIADDFVDLKRIAANVKIALAFLSILDVALAALDYIMLPSDNTFINLMLHWSK
jgi:hypothetical protein